MPCTLCSIVEFKAVHRLWIILTSTISDSPTAEAIGIVLIDLVTILFIVLLRTPGFVTRIFNTSRLLIIEHINFSLKFHQFPAKHFAGSEILKKESMVHQKSHPLPLSGDAQHKRFNGILDFIENFQVFIRPFLDGFHISPFICSINEEASHFLKCLLHLLELTTDHLIVDYCFFGYHVSQFLDNHRHNCIKRHVTLVKPWDKSDISLGLISQQTRLAGSRFLDNHQRNCIRRHPFQFQ